MQSTSDLIGSAEAAETLRIDRSTLTRWVKAGRLVPVLRGSGTTGEMFFNRADVLALLSPTSSRPVDDSLVSAGRALPSGDAA